MIPVAEARARILEAFGPLPAETVSVAQALGRVLAENLVSRLDQPPHDVSAMDGYAVRVADVADVPATLRVIGDAPAGHPFSGQVGPGEAVRLFTGSLVPPGADTIVIQEDTERDGDHVTVTFSPPHGHYVRPAGLDFRRGDQGAPAGHLMSVRDVGLAAAMNVAWLRVRRRPRIAILATGDETVMPGSDLGPGQIIASNGLALAAFIKTCGGEAVDLGIAPDDRAALMRLWAGAGGADLLLTPGGASVGDHDLMRSVFGETDLSLDFYRVAMRPGKPLIFGRIGATPILGLPGNPVSALVCAFIFLRPVMAKLLGKPEEPDRTVTAQLTAPLKANDHRQDYLRARLSQDGQGHTLATPFEKQDSSMLATLSHADGFIIRPPLAPAAPAGETVPVLPFVGGDLGF